MTPACGTEDLDDGESPAWHEAILSQRLEKIEAGLAVWLDFGEAMDGLEAKHSSAAT